jgi:putative ABC transport system ATP-binding protein
VPLIRSPAVTTPLLAFDHVWKLYPGDGATPRAALADISISLAPGEKGALVGRSGSGKSTLLHLAAAIDVPSRGRVLLDGRDVGAVSEAERTRLRRETVGLVFQFFHLLPHLTVLENVLLPSWIAGRSDGSRERARTLLDRTELGDRASDRVDRLSGGEMQRVALCRALLPRPRLLLADEPTGNLDDETGRAVMRLLLEMVREEGTALLVATHSRDLAAEADTLWRLHSGILERG